ARHLAFGADAGQPGSRFRGAAARRPGPLSGSCLLRRAGRWPGPRGRCARPALLDRGGVRKQPRFAGGRGLLRSRPGLRPVPEHVAGSGLRRPGRLRGLSGLRRGAAGQVPAGQAGRLLPRPPHTTRRSRPRPARRRRGPTGPDAGSHARPRGVDGQPHTLPLRQGAAAERGTAASRNGGSPYQRDRLVGERKEQI
ncbi:MAG: CDP-diacylglycerol--serine O-phosphatidyltransferase, partial [uncultured Rubrobacteraceae bacterium]